MALKQVEDRYNAMTPDERKAAYPGPRKQELGDKLQGYGEGVIHGWEAAAKAVSETTNGLFTLQEPREITEWRARLKRAR